MLTIPRVIVIDDDENDLRVLTDSLGQTGTACIQVHYRDPGVSVATCPHVRLMFFDLHLVDLGASERNERHFSTIGGIIEEQIKPSGPYFIVLWTNHTHHAEKLKDFLWNRLQGVSKPVAVVPLDKKIHIVRAKDPAGQRELARAIDELVEKQPEFATLLDWEERVLGAAADTVDTVVKLATRQNWDDPAGGIRRLLTHLGIASVGRENVQTGRFVAVNEALLPIVADRIAFLQPDERSANLLSKVLSAGTEARGLDEEEAAALNHLLHIADDSDSMNASWRGAVLLLDEVLKPGSFEGRFGLPSPQAACKEFNCAELSPQEVQKCRWVLIQSQAACDFAQRKAGLLPFIVGVEVVYNTANDKKKPSPALWVSPYFEMNNEVRRLHVNYRFQLWLSEGDVRAIKPVYRIREDLLNDLTYHIHTYAARPGFISLRKGKDVKLLSEAPVGTVDLS